MEVWDRIVETMRRIARQEVERVLRMQPTPRLGTALQYDPKTHRVRYMAQPDGVTPNWAPLSTPWAGPGWGFVAPMLTGQDIGEQVKIGYPEYGANEGVVLGRLFDERNPPPSAAANAEAGEAYLVGKTGSLFAITNDGKVQQIASGILFLNGTAVQLGGSGGPAVARVGDTVTCPAGTGHITTGSGKVTCA